MTDVNTTIYEKINEEQLSALELKHTWIGITISPKFNLNGELITPIEH